MSHGTFCFMSFDGYGWYLSATAALLYLSWIVHNLVAWLKIKPFLTVRASRVFIGTLSLTLGPIILQIVNNFRFFNNINDLYVRVRAYEVLMRLVRVLARALPTLILLLGTLGGYLPALFSSTLSRHAIHCRFENSLMDIPALR